jgi:hypothetical protein
MVMARKERERDSDICVIADSEGDRARTQHASRWLLSLPLSLFGWLLFLAVLDPHPAAAVSRSDRT